MTESEQVDGPPYREEVTRLNRVLDLQRAEIRRLTGALEHIRDRGIPDPPAERIAREALNPRAAERGFDPDAYAAEPDTADQRDDTYDDVSEDDA